MASRLDEFREFVARFPKVHDEVAQEEEHGNNL